MKRAPLVSNSLQTNTGRRYSRAGYAKAKPPTHRVSMLIVPCPQCKQPVGERFISPLLSVDSSLLLLSVSVLAHQVPILLSHLIKRAIRHHLIQAILPKREHAADWFLSQFIFTAHALPDVPLYRAIRSGFRHFPSPSLSRSNRTASRCYRSRHATGEPNTHQPRDRFASKHVRLRTHTKPSSSTGSLPLALRFPSFFVTSFRYPLSHLV